MLDFISTNESLINFIGLPIFLMAAFIVENIRESKVKDCIYFTIFLLFIFLVFSVLYNGLTKAF